jgi:hypothetical protein
MGGLTADGSSEARTARSWSRSETIGYEEEESHCDGDGWSNVRTSSME